MRTEPEPNPGAVIMVWGNQWPAGLVACRFDGEWRDVVEGIEVPFRYWAPGWEAPPGAPEQPRGADLDDLKRLAQEAGLTVFPDHLHSYDCDTVRESVFLRFLALMAERRG